MWTMQQQLKELKRAHMRRRPVPPEPEPAASTRGATAIPGAGVGQLDEPEDAEAAAAAAAAAVAEEADLREAARTPSALEKVRLSTPDDDAEVGWCHPFTLLPLLFMAAYAAFVFCAFVAGAYYVANPGLAATEATWVAAALITASVVTGLFFRLSLMVAAFMLSIPLDSESSRDAFKPFQRLVDAVFVAGWAAACVGYARAGTSEAERVML